MPNASKATDKTAGMTAHQNTARKSSPVASISATASNGPEMRPRYRAIGVTRTLRRESLAAPGPPPAVNARRTAHALADAIDQTGRKDRRACGRERKERLGRCTETVAKQCERFSPSHRIAQNAGENFDE
jgi:hypothetical protein